MNNKNRKITSEAEDLITLGKLLRKKRNLESEEKVEKIMRSSLSVNEKIKKILKIDERKKKASVEPETRPALKETRPVLKETRPILNETRPVKQYELKSEDESTDKHILWNRRKIKATPSQSSFFYYLFREQRKIRDFGEKTQIFSLKLLRPGIHLNKKIGMSFIKDLQSWSQELLNTLDIMLKSGWLYLNKTDYNLLAMLKKLCEKINSTNFIQINYKDKNLIEKFRSLGNLFLFLHYRQEYPEIIFSSFRIIFNKDPNCKEDPQKVIGLVKKILFKDAAQPSLYNFLLGLNMFKYKRYIRLQDLINNNRLEVISRTNFDCSQEVQNKIDTYIEESSTNLKTLHKRKLEIMRIKNFIPFDNSDQIDFSSLLYFYESAQSEKRYNFRKDKKNMKVIFERFLLIFDSSFRNILNGKILISGVGYEVEIFSRDIFHMEFSRIEYLIKKLEKHSFDFASTFPWKRYLLLNRSSIGATPNEAEVMHVVYDGISYLREIADKLLRVLSSHQPAEKKEDEPAPIEEITLKGRPFSLPYANKKIKSTPSLGRKTIAETFTYIISIVYLICLFLNDKYTVGLLGREKSVNNEISLKLELLERIANPDAIETIRERYSP